MPEVSLFTPVGVPPDFLKEICLSIEEAEAIRLRDMEGLEQEECAQRMRISRPTFHRVLENARRKIAEALINGKAIRIKGGNFEMAARRFKCDNDGHEWEMCFDEMVAGSPSVCPQCNSPNIQPVYPPGLRGRGWGRRHRGKRHW
jgi:predicted DNA-binding protein (UPF0251 family)